MDNLWVEHFNPIIVNGQQYDKWDVKNVKTGEVKVLQFSNIRLAKEYAWRLNSYKKT